MDTKLIAESYGVSSELALEYLEQYDAVFSKLYNNRKKTYFGLPLFLTYEEAENYELKDNTKEYIKGLKAISYKRINTGAIQKATYGNEERTKVFDVNILYYKDSGLYDLSIYQLMECREIKVTLVNKDSFYTKINGSDNDILNYYNDSNFLNDDKETQVKEIEIVKKGSFPGEKENRVIYNFIYDSKAECFLY